MARWRAGQTIYEKLVSDIINDTEEKVINHTPENYIWYGKTVAPDFVNKLTVTDLVSIHEYLMYMTEMKPDPRFPTYVYSGGDRIASVTRYLQKNIDLEHSKQYA